MIQRLELHPADQPLFSLALQTSACAVELWVNDVPIYREQTGSATDCTLPINEWLFQGPNEIRCRAKALTPEGARARVELQFRRLRQPLKQAIPLAVLDWSPPAGTETIGEAEGPMRPEAEPQIPPAVAPGSWTEFSWIRHPRRRSPGGYVELSGQFTLPAPWPRCPWGEATVLRSQPNLPFSIWQLTEEFRGVLARRDVAMLARITSEPRQALEAVYHLAAGEVEEVLLYPKLLQNPAWRVANLPEEGWSVEWGGQGRIVRVIDAARGESVLRLINESEGLEAIVDVWWALNNRWVVIR
ncbi:MAG TPA: hypothetical protein VGM54_03305 [Chthoniobacter sp.]|jgi:hypothetical protein